MRPPAGPSARQTCALARALIIAMLLPAGALAQDDGASTSPARDGSEAVTPQRFAAATVPPGPSGASVRDILGGGPGYIAVGGGAEDGADPRAFAWFSDDGRTWAAATIDEDATAGVIEAVSTLPAGGFVAVGNDTSTGTGLAWYSADGVSWEGVTAESFAASVMADVVATDDGATAVGSEAYPDGRKGLVWSTIDGRTWVPDGQLAMVPLVAGTSGTSLIAAGRTGALGKEGGQAVAARAAGTDWVVSGPLGEPESRIVDLAGTADGLVAAGWQQRPGKRFESTLFISEDGASWVPVTHRRLRGLDVAAVGASEDGVMLMGTKGGEPVAFWTRDRAAFETIRFPGETELEGLTIDGGGMVPDGSMAFALGRAAGQPAIWYSRIE